MKLKLVEQDKYMFIASYGDEFEVTDIEYSKITSGLYKVQYKDGFIFTDNKEAIVRHKIKKDKQIKIEKSIAINEIATLTDQLNLLAEVLDTITNDVPNQAIIDNAKAKFSEIKVILNK